MKLALAVVLLACACGGEGGGTEGRFHLAWQITDNDVSIDCTSGGVETVRVVTTFEGVNTTEEFLCGDGEATTGPREPGVYSVTLNALDSADAVVATSSDDGVIQAGQTTDLGVFPLDIAAEVCDASTCPAGCCDDTGACVDPQTDTACGRGGISCTDCTGGGQVCNATEGVCID